MANSPAGQTPDINSGPQEIRLLIHQSVVGGIIGKGGSKIKEIREESGANIKVYGACAPQSSDRCVVVQGTNEKIVAALHPIMHIVVSLPFLYICFLDLSTFTMHPRLAMCINVS